MITKFIRLLLLCLVALAVPAQGLAAASAGVCMALGHHDALEVAMHGHGVAQHGGASHAAGDPYHSEYDGPADGAQCGPCAACCAAGSMSVLAGALLPAAGPGAAVAFEAARPPDFLAELPHRPPLTRLA